MKKGILIFFFTAAFLSLLLLIIPDWWLGADINEFNASYPKFGSALYYYSRYGLIFQFSVSYLIVLFLLLKIAIKKLNIDFRKTTGAIAFICLLIILLLPFYGFYKFYFAKEHKNFQRKEIVSWEMKGREISDSLSLCKTLQDSIICINRFAYRDALHGAEHLQIEKIIKEINVIGAEAFWHYFSQDRHSVNCRGNAAYNASLYRKFMNGQVEAYLYTISIPDDPEEKGHTINLLATKQKEHQLFYLVDPMFNSYYSNKEGALIDLKTMILNYKLSDISNIKITHLPEKAQYLTYMTFITGFYQPIFDKSKGGYFLRSNNEKYPLIYNCERTLENYLKLWFSEDYRDIAMYYGRADLTFENAGDFVNCFAFVSNIEGKNGELILKEIKDDLKEHEKE